MQGLSNSRRLQRCSSSLSPIQHSLTNYPLLLPLHPSLCFPRLPPPPAATQAETRQMTASWAPAASAARRCCATTSGCGNTPAGPAWTTQVRGAGGWDLDGTAGPRRVLQGVAVCPGPVCPGPGGRRLPSSCAAPGLHVTGWQAGPPSRPPAKASPSQFKPLLLSSPHPPAGTTFLFRFAADGTVRFHDLNTRLDLRKRKRGAAPGEEDEEDHFQQPEKVGGAAGLGLRKLAGVGGCVCA